MGLFRSSFEREGFWQALYAIIPLVMGIVALVVWGLFVLCGYIFGFAVSE